MPQIKHGIFMQGASTGIVDITDVGFQPSGVIIYERNPINTTAVVASMGFSDGVNQAATSTVGVSGPSYGRNSSASHIIYRTSSGATSILHEASLVSFLSNGFRLNFSTATTSINYSYIAFSNDIGVKVGTFSINALGTTDVTSVGFQPSGGLNLWMPSHTTNSTAFAFGHFADNGNQMMYGGNNGSSISTGWGDASNAFSVYAVGGATPATSAQITEMLPTGFRINATAQNGLTFAYMCFDTSIRIKVGDVGVTVSTTFSEPMSGAKPFGALFSRVVGGTNTQGINIGIGAVDHTYSQSSTGAYGFNNTAGAAGNLRRTSDASHALIRTSTTADVILANVTSMTAEEISGTVFTATAASTFLYTAFLPKLTTLTVNDVSHTQTTDATTLTQKHVLATQEALQPHVLDAITLTQKHVLAVMDLNQAQTVSTTVLIQGGMQFTPIAVQAERFDRNRQVDGGSLTAVNDVIDRYQRARIINGQYEITDNQSGSWIEG